MKRSALAIWFLLAVVAASLVLLADPFGWLAGEPATAAPGPAVAGPSDPDPAPPVELEPVLSGPAEEAVPGPERRAIDPLLEERRVAFRVLDPLDRPVADAQILLLRGEALLFDADTDEKGEVALAADGEPARLFLAVVHRPVEEREVLLEPGLQEIRLEEGARLAGRFAREDGLPTGKLRFSIHSDQPFSSIAAPPAAVEDALRVQALKRDYAVEETDEAGRFAVAGLQPGWSGRLWPRGGWKVVSSSHGDEMPKARGVRLHEPVSDLLLLVAPQPALHGRLVLSDDGSPLAGAKVSVLIRSPDSESAFGSTTHTDEDGHFLIQPTPERISSLDLHLGLAFRESPSILALHGAAIPADGDLGDVIVDEVRDVPFRLQDLVGQPIAGGTATALGVSSGSTDREGLGELRWLPRSVDSMHVEASGFVPAGVEIPPVVAAPLLVILEPANELIVKLRLPEGADPTQFKVALVGEERITAVAFDDRSRQRAHATRWDYITPVVFMRAAPDTFLVAKPDEHTGVVRFHALRSGAEIRLEVHGITGDMIYHSEVLAPLAPAERREIEVRLDEGMIAFRGRVLDQDGDPLSMASLQLSNQILGWTGDDGSFLCFLSEPETGTLLVQHNSCATRYLHGYAVPTDGRPVEFRLSPARRVTVEVVDGNGDPVPQAEVWLEHGGFVTNTHRIEGHRHVAGSVPEASFVFRVDLAGREYRQEHDPTVPELRFVVPVHGRLTAFVSGATTATRDGRFTLQLSPPEGEPAQPLFEGRGSAPNLRIEVPAVHPGTYAVVLRYAPGDEERAAGRVEEASSPVSVTIEPGEEAEIHLSLPGGIP